MEKIAMMAAWNTDSGVAIHAEPIAKAWIEMGYKLQIFTFLKDDYHGEEITGEDENYVTRCFGTSSETNYLDPRPILTSDYSLLVIQDLGMLPVEKLAKIFSVIKKKAKTVHVVHENIASPDPCFYQLDWDAVVCFDPRQQGFLNAIYGNKAHYIPFPCFSLRIGNKLGARKKLNLPLDKKIVVVFCRRGYKLYMPALPDPELKDVLFLVLTNKEIKEKYPQIEIRKDEFFPHSLFDDYLFAADAVILHKMSTAPQEIGILSSTAYQCLGTGCPILAPRISDFFSPFEKEVFKYADRRELKELLLNIFTQGERYRNNQKATEKFVKKYSPQNIAKQFITLFHSL